MTVRKLMMAAASARQVNFTLRTYARPSLVPPNYGNARFVWQLQDASGYGIPGLTSVQTDGLSIWDWDANRNRYEMVNFQTVANWDAAYSSFPNGIFCMVNATTILAANNSSTTSGADTKAYRAVTTIGNAPDTSITFTTPMTYAYDEPTVAVAGYSTPVGWNGNMFFGFCSASSAFTAADGWVQKLSSTAAARNSTALRSGLATDSTHGFPAYAGIAGLGGATPNGYVVADVSDNVAAGATKRFQLVNCTGTPVAVGTQLSYACAAAGAATAPWLHAIGATNLVAFDFGTAMGGGTAGRANLLSVNSATAPTTLTKVTQVSVPPPLDFASSLLNFSNFFGDQNASNCWFGEGKLMVWAVWQTLSGQNFARPAILRYDGVTLTASIPLTDMNGKPSPVISRNSFLLLYDNAVLSAPGGKAVLIIPRTDSGVSQSHDQWVYQL